MTKELTKDDPRFKYGPPLIQTAEDAYQAYITEAISRDEYEEACGRFGSVARPEPVRFGVLVQKPSADDRREAREAQKLGDERVEAYNENRKIAEADTADPLLRPEKLGEPKEVDLVGSTDKPVEPTQPGTNVPVSDLDRKNAEKATADGRSATTVSTPTSVPKK